jgi:hypothetical protein
MRPIRRNEKKMRELILLVAELTKEDPSAGAIKLNKILFHADFRAYLKLGQPITGHPYVHREFGPAPKDLRPIRASLQREGDADVAEVDVGAPKAQDRIVPKRPADRSMFSPDELRIVQDVVAELWDLRGMEVSRDSHKLPGWRATSEGEEIPYQTAFVSPTVGERSLERAAQIVREHGWG